jgi:hypothetical protein
MKWLKQLRAWCVENKYDYVELLAEIDRLISLAKEADK